MPPPDRVIHMPKDAACWECGYLLDGLPSNVCPECGRPFDPEDPRTFRTALRDYLSPRLPGWHILLIAIATIWSLFECSKPMRLFSTTMCCCWPILLLVLPIHYVWHLARCGSIRYVASYPWGPTRRKALGRWLFTPLCYLLIAFSTYTGWPLHLRFLLSQRAFDQAALSMNAGKTPPTPQFYGLYRVSEILPVGQGCSLFVTGMMVGGGGEPTGFLYCPNGRSPLAWHQITPVWYEGAD